MPLRREWELEIKTRPECLCSMLALFYNFVLGFLSYNNVLNGWAVFQSPENGNVSVNNDNETPQSSEIRRVASLIKQEIKKCTGINIKPLNTQDVSMETARQLILDSLHLLIKQLVVSYKRARPSNALNQSTTIEDERQILSIAQDTNCNKGSFVQIAADNNDLNEQTIDG